MKMNTLLALILACSLFAATPAMAEQADTNNGGTGIVQYSDLDQKLADSAEKAIEQYGNGKVFQLEEAFKDSYFVDKKKKRIGSSNPRIGAPLYRPMQFRARYLPYR
ncbi:hypothetical protein PAALTS15_17721 [Paenibacillus alvei TS-15]|uniref:Uncharacterized protein n=1 Tax=Paenibacillus alvei TS-15 TaxID=1117108 RepID=S9SMJ5_PAEAL|nr:hypothetical protein [Paenibacillus alvei]EPY05919.1 hypothetical protein PAALTS15_17721 [Paenibacillus alvei TS-15]